MSASPAASVLLPVRDAERFLDAALDSLRRQTLADLEILLHDDGSTDGSLAVAERAAAEDRRIVVTSGPPRGIVAALNALAARSRAPLLVRMDADDVAHPTRVERLVEAARADPRVDFLASRVRYVPRESVTDGMRRYEARLDGVLDHAQIVRERFVECPLPHPAWAIRRRAFERLGGYADGPFPEDYELFLRAVDAGLRFHKVGEVLLDWREGAHRLSRRDPRYDRRAFFELKVRHLVPFLEVRGRPVAVLGTGPAGRRWARRLRREGLDAQAVDDVPADVTRCFVLGTAGTPEGRASTRERLEALGLEEGRDFLCVQ